MIPLIDCKPNFAYRLRSRNLSLGVFNYRTNGFVGIREKFGNRYLFTEYHYDTGPPFGTAYPYEEIGVCPIEDLRTTIRSEDTITGRLVTFDRPVDEGGKGWYFLDTGESSLAIRPVGIPNEELYLWLASFGECEEG